MNDQEHPLIDEYCPDCGTVRVALFQFCRKCGLDYDALDASGELPGGPYSSRRSGGRGTPLRVRLASWRIRLRRDPRHYAGSALRAIVPFAVVGVLAVVVVTTGIPASLAALVGPPVSPAASSPVAVASATPTPEPTPTPSPAELPETGPTPFPSSSLRAYTSVEPLVVPADDNVDIGGALGQFTWRSVEFSSPKSTLHWTATSRTGLGCRVDMHIEPTDGAPVDLHILVRGIRERKGDRSLAAAPAESTMTVQSTCPDWTLQLRGVKP